MKKEITTGSRLLQGTQSLGIENCRAEEPMKLMACCPTVARPSSHTTPSSPNVPHIPTNGNTEFPLSALFGLIVFSVTSAVDIKFGDIILLGRREKF
jgi:hypothetical protein